jgi:hypothetical protein
VCFIGKCDCRLPTIGELQAIVDLSAPGCGSGAPCTTIPGSTAYYYWSSSTYATDPQLAWIVFFGDGYVNSFDKNFNRYVRAVRGGS